MKRTTSLLAGCLLSVWIVDGRSLAADGTFTTAASDYSEQERLAFAPAGCDAGRG